MLQCSSNRWLLRIGAIKSSCFDVHRLPHLYGQRLGQALFRSQPEDFQVDEIINLCPSGEGEHLLLHIRKREQNSHWVAGLLAQLSGIERNDVGFCGLKDRFAVTTQWYSLHLPGRQIDLQQLQHSDFEILQFHRHHKKLRRGMHQGNRFKILLRDCSVDPVLLAQRLENIERQGVPNYFTEQRFGHNGGNLHQVEKLVASGRLKGNRRGTGMYLSAARSWLFNLIVARHIEMGSLMLDAEVGHTGALWGRGRANAPVRAAEIEDSVMADWQHWCYALEHGGLKQQRRNLLLKPQQLTVNWLDSDQLQINFDLPCGCFATALLREIAELFRPQYKAL